MECLNYSYNKVFNLFKHVSKTNDLKNFLKGCDLHKLPVRRKTIIFSCIKLQKCNGLKY